MMTTKTAMAREVTKGATMKGTMGAGELGLAETMAVVVVVAVVVLGMGWMTAMRRAMRTAVSKSSHR